jgi:hypothetical protein
LRLVSWCNEVRGGSTYPGAVQFLQIRSEIYGNLGRAGKICMPVFCCSSCVYHLLSAKIRDSVWH